MIQYLSFWFKELKTLTVGVQMSQLTSFCSCEFLLSAPNYVNILYFVHQDFPLCLVSNMFFFFSSHTCFSRTDFCKIPSQGQHAIKLYKILTCSCHLLCRDVDTYTREYLIQRISNIHVSVEQQFMMCIVCKLLGVPETTFEKSKLFP